MRITYFYFFRVKGDETRAENLKLVADESTAVRPREQSAFLLYGLDFLFRKLRYQIIGASLPLYKI